jgi:ABC-type transport system involved in cytochrome bd biosynthesis fused ATPase/permease subunit
MPISRLIAPDMPYYQRLAWMMAIILMFAAVGLAGLALIVLLILLIDLLLSPLVWLVGAVPRKSEVTRRAEQQRKRELEIAKSITDPDERDAFLRGVEAHHRKRLMSMMEDQRP